MSIERREDITKFKVVTVKFKFQVGRAQDLETIELVEQGKTPDIPLDKWWRGVFKVEDFLNELKPKMIKGVKKRYREGDFKRDLYDFFVVRLMELMGLETMLSTELSLQVVDRKTVTEPYVE